MKAIKVTFSVKEDPTVNHKTIFPTNNSSSSRKTYSPLCSNIDSCSTDRRITITLFKTNPKREPSEKKTKSKVEKNLEVFS